MRHSIKIKGRMVSCNHEIKWYRPVKRVKAELSWIWQVFTVLFKEYKIQVTAVIAAAGMSVFYYKTIILTKSIELINYIKDLVK